MGYHIICNVTCQILPEYLPFIHGKYLRGTDASNVAPLFRTLLQLWNRLDLASSVYEHNLSAEGVFTCHIEKKPYNHRGDLWHDYEEFLKHIICPISSVILSCTISEDDMGMRERVYTDAELRNVHLRLGDLVEEVEHMYEDDRIIGTIVFYKRAFKHSMELDITRLYKNV